MADTKREKTDAEIELEVRSTEKTFIQKLKDAPKVKLRGDIYYKQYLGDYFTFLFNGIPFTLRFDGQYHEFPEPVANRLRKKLDAIAGSISPVNSEVKL